MNTVMKLLVKVVVATDNISTWAGKTASWMTLVLMATTAYEVVARYGFNSPTIWALEFGLFLFTGLWLFTGAYTHVEDAHIRIDLIYSRLSPRGKATINTITAPIALFVCVILIYELYKQGILAYNIKEHSASSWSPPTYIMKMLLPVGAVMLLLAVISTIIKNAYFAITGKEWASWK